VTANKNRNRKRKSTTRRRESSRRRPNHSRAAIEIREVESLRSELQRVAKSARPPRWNANPDDVRRSVVKLVLTLVELIRQLLERQALRRVDAGTLTPAETEAVGLALMRLEQTVRESGEQFDLAPEDLNLDLGPVGKLI
jgi:Gas vesicle protein K